MYAQKQKKQGDHHQVRPRSNSRELRGATANPRQTVPITVFVCSGSSCRSPLAATIFKYNTGKETWAFAAGKPGGKRSDKAVNAGSMIAGSIGDEYIWQTKPGGISGHEQDPEMTYENTDYQVDEVYYMGSKGIKKEEVAAAFPHVAPGKIKKINELDERLPFPFPDPFDLGHWGAVRPTEGAQKNNPPTPGKGWFYNERRGWYQDFISKKKKHQDAYNAIAKMLDAYTS